MKRRRSEQEPQKALLQHLAWRGDTQARMRAAGATVGTAAEIDAALDEASKGLDIPAYLQRATSVIATEQGSD
jgi:hypothetical protein